MNENNARINRDLVQSYYNTEEVDQKIITWACSRAFTESEVDEIRKLKKDLEFKPAVIGTEGRDSRTVESYRTTKIAWLYCNDETEWIYRKILECVLKYNRELWNFDIFGLYEAIQYAEYDKGAHYDWHIDTGAGRFYRKISCTLQLSDPSEYKGGELLVKTNKDDYVAGMEKGQLSVFPSIALHKVTPVTSGRRESLVIWVSGPPWR